MGIFFEVQPVQSKVRESIRDALEEDPRQVPNLEAEAAARASAVAEKVRQGVTFQPQRFLIALAVFLTIVVAAIVTESFGLNDSPKALFFLAGTILGLIVGFLGGEKPGT
jgi:hypothetical protein